MQFSFENLSVQASTYHEDVAHLLQSHAINGYHFGASLCQNEVPEHRCKHLLIDNCLILNILSEGGALQRATSAEFREMTRRKLLHTKDPHSLWVSYHCI